MAVTETVSKVSVTVLLNNGVDSEGKVRTVGVNLGSLNPEGYDNAKALAVISALTPCLSKVLYGVRKTTVSGLVNG